MGEGLSHGEHHGGKIGEWIHGLMHPKEVGNKPLNPEEFKSDPFEKPITDEETKEAVGELKEISDEKATGAAAEEAIGEFKAKGEKEMDEHLENLN